MSLGNPGEASRSDQEIQDKIRPQISSVNVLCICGAVIGVAAALCSWYVVSEGSAEESTSIVTTLLEITDGWNPYLDPWLWMAIGLSFIGGTVLAFVTPLACIPQAFGLWLTVAHILDVRHTLILGGVGSSIDLGLGFYLGVLSAGLILASIVVPVGPGFETGARGLRNRLLVRVREEKRVVYYKRWSLARNPPKKLGERLGEMRIRWASRLTQRPSKWTAIVVASIVWSVTVFSLAGDFPGDGQLVTLVEEGIAVDSYTFALGGAFHYFAYRVSLEEGENCTGWGFCDYMLDDPEAWNSEYFEHELSLDAQELDDGRWCTVDLGTRKLGALEVSMTVMDQLGDGIFSGCDSFVLTAQNGTYFEEDRVYGIWWATNRAMSWSGTEVSFVIHDGEIDSWVSKDWFMGL